MEVINIEKKQTVTAYKAIDGTIFDDRNECEKYDKTATAVIMAKYQNLVVKSMSEEDLFWCGSCDSTIDIVKITKQEDVDIILQAFSINGYSDFSKPSRICAEALENNDFIFISRGYEGDNFWVVDTLMGRLNHIVNQCDPGTVVILEDATDQA